MANQRMVFFPFREQKVRAWSVLVGIKRSKSFDNCALFFKRPRSLWHYLKPMTSNDYSKDHVSPANAGVQNGAPRLGTGFRGDDASPLVDFQVLVGKWKYPMLKAQGSDIGLRSLWLGMRLVQASFALRQRWKLCGGSIVCSPNH